MNNSLFGCLTLIFLSCFTPLKAQNTCPFVVDPVCGINGITYLNSCYAETAGVTEYTAGVCFSTCIDPSQMNPNAVCTQTFDPVCGCNEITYLNSCVAEANGVTAYKQGACNNTNDCYDPILVATADGTLLHYPEGIITLICETDSEPVCACDGTTYLNPCIAEASGITFYTFGACNTGCVDPDEIDPNANCPDNFEPVCACNNITYANACEAEAAGIVDYISGICGETSNWCQEATPIQCGDYLANESTLGEGNQIINYPGCQSGLNYTGPDKVYVINKTTVGDLQIRMEITSPNINLDLFLLADACDELRCLAASTEDNLQSNSETILFENAPIGIYYLVVDGRNATAQGSFRLELNCGYLQCTDAIPLTCGEPFPYSNLLGSDNVSMYTCSDESLGENNGPEVIHSFTLTSPSQIDISLTELSANLELFLLSDCDRNSCIDVSQNPGLNSESIVNFLDAGTYYIVVEGNNGATSDYTLLVDCNTNCNLGMFSLNPSAADCGSNTGSISLNYSGGTSPYIISWSGSGSGSFMTSSNSVTIPNLAPGFYTVWVRDANNCAENSNIIVESNTAFSASINPTSALCDQAGSLQINLSNGSPGYTVNISGPLSANLNTAANNFSIDNLIAGSYTLFIMDANGCVITESITINSDNNGFSYSYSTIDALCDNLGAISVNIQGGQPNYMVDLSGPVSRMGTLSNSSFLLSDLPGGNYLLEIIEANGCSHTEMISVEDDNIAIRLSPVSGACGETGSIILDISGNAGNYNINYTGPSSGTISGTNSTYLIADLFPGSYSFTVTDNQGCSDFETTTVSPMEGDLETELIPIHTTCGQSGAFWIDFENGSPNYTITWTGPVNGSTNTSNAGLDIPNIPEGEYTVEITDDNGCSNVHVVFIEESSTLNVSAIEEEATCSEPGSIQLFINDGTAPYVIVWNGPEAGYTVSDNNVFLLPDLTEGDYSIEITDAQGCNTSYNIPIYNTGAENEELNISGSAIGISCTNLGNIFMNIEGGQADYTINWSGPSSGSFNSSNGIVEINNLQSGQYFISVTDANGCYKSQTFEVPTTEEASLNIGGTALMAGCNNLGGILVEIDGGNGNYQINWSGASNGSVNTSDPAYLINSLPSGDYTVSVTDENGCEGTSNFIILTQEESDLSFSVNTTFTSCQENGMISIFISGGNPEYMIMWEGAALGMASTTNNNFYIPNAPSGTYTITIMDGSDCVQVQTITATSPDNNLNLTTSISNTACDQDNGAINLNIDGGQSIYNIRWTGPNSGNINTSNSNYLISGLAAGNYTLLVTDANGCEISKQLSIETAGGNLDVTANLLLGNCGTESSIELLFNNGQAVYNISWNGPETGSISTSNNAYIIPNLTTGLYNISISDAIGCTTTEQVVVNNSATSFTMELESLASNCGMEGAILVNVVGGTDNSYTISWSGPESGSILTVNHSYLIPDLPSGTYSITTIGSNGCQETKEVTLTNEPSGFRIVLIPNPGACGDEGSITVEINGGVPNYSVSWIGPENGDVSTNEDEYEITGLVSGTYIIAVTDASGCTDQRAATLINPENEGITLDLTPINGACGSEGSIWLDVIGGSGIYTLSWSGPESGTVSLVGNGYNIPGLSSGLYTVEIEDAAGCGGSEIINLVNPEDEFALELTPINGACGSEASIWIDIIGGEANYILTWSGPESGSISIDDDGYNIPGLSAGQYEVRVTDANNCSAVSSTSLVIAEEDLAVSLSAHPGFCEEGASINLQMSGGNPNYSISWIGPENGAISTNNETYTIPDLLPGTYLLIVTDANNCNSTEMITLVAAESELSLEAAPMNNGCENLGAIDLEIIGSQPPYSVEWTGTLSGNVQINMNEYTIRDLPSGQYSIVIRDQNGCSEELIASIDNTVPPTEFTTELINGNCETLPDVLIHIQNGNPNYLVSWQGPQNGSTVVNDTAFILSGLPEGSYEVMVSDALNCTAIVQEIEIFTESSDFSAEIIALPTDCGIPGSVDIIIHGGEAPYNFEWSGPVSGSLETPHQLYNITDLPSGTYTFTITDIKGCAQMNEVDIDNGSSTALDVSVMVLNGECDGLGSLWIDFYNGYPQYYITWEGPISGSTTTDENIHDILNLPSGEYTLFIQDVFGCVYTDVFLIQNPENNLEISLNAQHGGCEELGAIQVDISGGTAVYEINWAGMSVGSTTTYDQSTMITQLQSGQYEVEVIDIFGCSQSAVINISNAEGNLPEAAFIYEDDQLTVDFNNQGSDGDYTWDFGDGNTSDGINPSHTYQENGSYTVCLTVENNCGTDLYCEELEVQITQGLTPTHQQQLTRFVLEQNYPNPFGEETLIRFYISEAMPVDLLLHDELGQLVMQQQLNAKAGENELKVNAASLSNGLYFYTLRSSDISATKKLLILK